jgi:hypothetical protein
LLSNAFALTRHFEPFNRPRRTGPPLADPGAVDLMEGLRDLLKEQARAFDAIFHEMSGRAFDCIDSSPRQALSYVRLALRAQAKSCAAIEAAMKIDRRRLATLRTVAKFGAWHAPLVRASDPLQAPKEKVHEKTAIRPHAPGITARNPRKGAPLRRAHPRGDAMSVAGGGRQGALPDAWRQRRQRRPARQPQRLEAWAPLCRNTRDGARLAGIAAPGSGVARKTLPAVTKRPSTAFSAHLTAASCARRTQGYH